jgi:tRNA splicing endonuclease
LAAQIHNKGKTGTTQEKGYLLLRPEEALYCDYRNDFELTTKEREKFNTQNYIVYRNLKERGLIVKVDGNGLRLFDRLVPTKGQSSAIVISKNYKEEIDFSDIFNELDKGLDRRVQIGIIDSEKDVVYYVTKIMEWPKTKRNVGNKSTIEDSEIKELTEKGYQVNSGLKFGTHYRVYNYESKHAPWLIHIVKEGMTWLDIARMVRVGHGVNKIIVLAHKQRWLSIEWIKP